MDRSAKPSHSALLARIEERLAERGISEREALLKAGMQQDFVRDIRRRGYRPKADKLVRLAKALDIPASVFLRALSEPEPQVAENIERLPQFVRRFRAARWACWEDRELAADRLGVGVDDLNAMEEGCMEIDDELIVRFAGLTGVPLSWFRSGSMAALPGPIAARVGFYDLGLVPGAVEGEPSQRSGPSDREAVENA